MISILRNLAFVIIFFINFLHYTYAPWTTEPVVPPPDEIKSCEDWLWHHKFREDGDTNRFKSFTRVRKYDQDVYIWAALYASYLTVFRQYEPIDPVKFCHAHKMSNGITDVYVTLKDVQKTCAGWINLYGFSATLRTIVWESVNRRSSLEDSYIAIWPALYAKYINVDRRRAETTQEEFCLEMGQDDLSQLSPFMSIFATYKTCQEWIEFAGYNDDVEHNMEKVMRQKDEYKPLMNKYVLGYYQELRQYYQEEDCVGWLEYHDFTENAMTNRGESRIRDRQFDPDVCIWAALYAAFLTAFHHIQPIKPNDFCRSHEMYYGIKQPYVALKDSLKTCKNWIKLNGLPRSTPEHTWLYIRRRSRVEDNFITLFPALYAQYVSVHESRATTTRTEFCRGLGFANNTRLLPFVSIYATYKTCKEWLDFVGFTNNIDENMEIALQQKDEFKPFMNEFVLSYSQELRQYINLNVELNPEHTHNLMNNPETDLTTKTPEEFCNNLGQAGAEKRRYKPSTVPPIILT